MCDPGSIVGAVSLTLQIVQRLKTYYNEFRSFHSDIDAVVTQSERIVSILNALEKPVQGLWRGRDELCQEVRASIRACDEARLKVKAHQQKCSECDLQPENLRKKLVLVKTRCLYPFRKDTLGDLQRQLDRMLENLQTIIQVLQIDASMEFHDKASRKASEIHSEITLIRQREICQTQLLEVIGKRSEEQLAISIQQESTTERLLRNQSADLKSYVEHSMQGLQNDIVQLCRGAGTFPAPSMGSDSSKKGWGNSQPSNPANAHASKRARNSWVAPFPTCTCTKASHRCQTHSTRKWISAFWREENVHPPPCALAMLAQKSTTAGLRLRLCRGTLGYLIEANCMWSTSSVSPTIIARNIVAYDSPAFALSRLFRSYIDDKLRPPHLTYEKHDHVITELTDSVSLVVRALQRLLKERRASVRDINPSGENLAHTLLHGFGIALGPLGPRLPGSEAHLHECFLNTVNLLKAMGYDVNERSQVGDTPVDAFFRGLTFDSPTVEDVNSLVQRIPWRIAFRDVEFSTQFLSCKRIEFWDQAETSNARRNMYTCFLPDDDLGSDCVDGPLLRAVTQRSSQQLRQILEARISDSSLDEALFRAISWPAGLEMLLIYRCIYQYDVESMVKRTLFWVEGANVNGDSLSILVRHIAELSHFFWLAAIQSESVEMMKSIATILYEEFQANGLLQCTTTSAREIFADFDFTTLGMPDGKRPLLGSPIPDSYYSSLPYVQDSLQFHVESYIVALDAAQALFDAGFKNLDINNPHTGTPLWIHASNADIRESNYFEVLEWFIAHGAKLDAVHPVWKTMPVHLIAEKAALLALRDSDAIALTMMDYLFPTEETATGTTSCTRDFLHTIFGTGQTDGCVCLCTPHGCNVISSALKVAHHQTHSIAQTDVLYRLKKTLRTIVELIPSALMAETWVCSSIVRGMTFEALDLTHTCHEHNHRIHHPMTRVSPNNPYSTKEILDIQFVEQQDIILFEDLLDEFYLAWKDWEGSVTDFVDGYWTARMEEVLEERNSCERIEEVERLAEVGVLVKTCELKQVEERTVYPYERGTREWFESKLGVILDGTYKGDERFWRC
ncbi:hypothetical protein CC80DRAFT_590342 [Byssothecium circinans]|uniref:Fungal N-terminal domain-containing protein n=1 Tax=Byssothecium circinans TaxID=147558 RepID=A0A6A5U592_9PLEO|nr:hypothetical protein CC80DRAFT_590342 [Byssothecium circinans]